jgi:hypothetical protein
LVVIYTTREKVLTLPFLGRNEKLGNEMGCRGGGGCSCTRSSFSGAGANRICVAKMTFVVAFVVIFVSSTFVVGVAAAVGGDIGQSQNCTGVVDEDSVIPGVGCDFEGEKGCTWTWKKPKGTDETGFRVSSAAQAIAKINQLKGDFSAPIKDADNKTDGKTILMLSL